MYCYCNNEPIDLVDSDGMWPSFKQLVSAVAAVATAVVVTAAVIAAAPAAACTATLGLMYYGASYTVATTLATVGVATMTTVAVTGAIDSACVSTTGYSPVKELVLQGSDEAYEYFQMASSVATGGVLQLSANSPGACFVEGTLVAAEDGLCPIEEIKAGDYVWAEEPETGERALKRVVRTFLKEKDELVHIQVGSETITCTTEHPFYIQGKGWVAAQDLKPNDKLELRDGEDAFVDAVRYEKLEKPIPVFNFEVEGFHTYYVGAGCVLVHNKCGNHGKEWNKKRKDYWKSQGALYENKVDPKALSASGKYYLSQNNIDRMKGGRAPIGTDGLSVSLHHNVGILVNIDDYCEILTSVHRKNYRSLHQWLLN